MKKKNNNSKRFSELLLGGMMYSSMACAFICSDILREEENQNINKDCGKIVSCVDNCHIK